MIKRIAIMLLMLTMVACNSIVTPQTPAEEYPVVDSESSYPATEKHILENEEDLTVESRLELQLRPTSTPSGEKTELQKAYEEARNRLTELAEINREWMLSGDSWLHYEGTDSGEGLEQYTFSDYDAWYQFDGEGKVNQQLKAISFNGVVRQLWAGNSEGFVAELHELRIKGVNSFDYAKPQLRIDKIEDVSTTFEDLKKMENGPSLIVGIKMEESKFNDIDCLHLEISYGGDPDSYALGLPPGQGKIGHVDNFYYDLETGARVGFSRAYVNEDGSVDPFNLFYESWTKVETPPEDVLEDMRLANQDIEVYKELFDVE